MVKLFLLGMLPGSDAADYNQNFKISTSAFLPPNMVTRHAIKHSCDGKQSGVDCDGGGTTAVHLNNTHLQILPPPNDPDLVRYAASGCADENCLETGWTEVGSLSMSTTTCALFEAAGMHDLTLSARHEIWPQCYFQSPSPDQTTVSPTDAARTPDIDAIDTNDADVADLADMHYTSDLCASHMYQERSYVEWDFSTSAGGFPSNNFAILFPGAGTLRFLGTGTVTDRFTSDPSATWFENKWGGSVTTGGSGGDSEYKTLAVPAGCEVGGETSWGVLKPASTDDSSTYPNLRLRFTPDPLIMGGITSSASELVVCPYYFGAAHNNNASTHSADHPTYHQSSSDTGTVGAFNNATPTELRIDSLCTPVAWSANKTGNCDVANDISCTVPILWSDKTYKAVKKADAVGRESTLQMGSPRTDFIDTSCDFSGGATATGDGTQTITLSRSNSGNDDCGVHSDWTAADRHMNAAGTNSEYVRYTMELCPDDATTNADSNSIDDASDKSYRCIQCACNQLLRTDVIVGPVDATYVNVDTEEMVVEQQVKLDVHFALYTDENYTDKYNEAYTLPKTTEKYYLRAKATMTSVRLQFSDCQAYAGESLDSEKALPLTGVNADNNYASNKLNLLVGFCDHPKFDYARHTDSAFTSNTNIDTISFHKFRFADREAVAFTCRTRICESSQASCGVCQGSGHEPGTSTVNWSFGTNNDAFNAREWADAPTVTVRLAEDDDVPTAESLAPMANSNAETQPTFRGIDSQNKKANQTSNQQAAAEDDMFLPMLIGVVAFALIFTMVAFRYFCAGERSAERKSTQPSESSREMVNKPNGKYAHKVSAADAQLDVL